jgi:hypothetical protein
MADKNALKERIKLRGEDDPGIWAIIEGYLNGEYNKSAMYEKIISHYGGHQKWNRKCADILLWEIEDWENEKGEA